MNKTNKFINESNIDIQSLSLPQIQIHMYGKRLVMDWSNASPVRSHWRFYWNPESGAEVSDKHKKYCLDKSFILVIPPGVNVKQVMVKPFATLFIHAAFDLAINDDANHLFAIPVSPPLKETIGRLCKDSLPQPLIVGEFVFAIISRLPARTWRPRISDSRIEDICRMLKKHPEQAWPNKALAKKAYFSENAFIRRFREVTGVPPQIFLRNLRLERAAALLLKNQLSVEEIAAACGFCDRHYLSRMFKKHFGQSPVRFRASNNTP